jgi:hypothetical protein
MEPYFEGLVKLADEAPRKRDEPVPGCPGLLHLGERQTHDVDWNPAPEDLISETQKFGRVGRGKGAWEARIRGERARAGTRPEACKKFS